MIYKTLILNFIRKAYEVGPGRREKEMKLNIEINHVKY